jgi:hypothetical protein
VRALPLLLCETSEGGAGEVSDQRARQRRHGVLEDTLARPVGPRPAYGGQIVSAA